MKRVVFVLPITHLWHMRILILGSYKRTKLIIYKTDIFSMNDLMVLYKHGLYKLPALRYLVFIYWQYVSIVNNHWMCCFVGSLLLQEKVKCLYFMLRVRLGSIIHLYCTELSMDRMMKPRVWTGPVIQGNVAQTTAGHEQSQNLYSSCSLPGYDKN